MTILSARLRWLDFIPAGLALGLYLGRISAEALFPSLPPWGLLLVAVTLIVVGIVLAAAGRRAGLDLSPLFALCIYVFWPTIYPALAVAVAMAAGVVIAAQVRCYDERVSYSLLLAGSLALYVHTLAPTMLPADAGEFQFVSQVLGIAHPPGYPLYTVLAKLFTLLPLADVAYRVNLFSAVTSALTLVVVAHAIKLLTGSTLVGWVAAAALAVAPTFWAQSTTANIRSLTALFTALQLGALIAYAQTGRQAHLLAFSIAMGLGITHHSSLVPLALPCVAFLLVTDPDLVRSPRRLLRPVLAFALSFSILLYLPVRSAMGAPFDPQPIRSLSAFLDHVLALGFRGDMFYFVQPDALLSRCRILCNILTFQFGVPFLLLGLCGVVAMLVRHKRLLLLCGGVFAINALLAVTYRAPQTVEYLMPAYVALVIMSAYGAWSAVGWLRARGAALVALASVLLAAVLAIAVLRLQDNYPSFRELSQDRSVREYAQDLLEQAPRSARILANWHYATPLWYLQYVENIRPDVDVVYVYPQGSEPIAQTWIRRLEESNDGRPTIVTNLYPEFTALSRNFRPLSDAWLVQEGPIDQIPEGIQRLDALFDERIRFSGYDLGTGVLSPADSLTVRLYWQPVVKLERDYSFFVHLVDDTGAPLGQGDLSHAAARYEVGEVILDEYRIPLLPTVMPGRYRLIAGVYITLDEGGWRRLSTADGRDAVLLAEVQVKASSRSPVTLHRLEQPFSQGYSLMGVDYDRTLPDQLRIYLHWRVDERLPRDSRLVLFSEATPLAEAQLPLLPTGSFFTTVHDVPTAWEHLAVEVQSTADGIPSALLGPWRLPIGHRLSLPSPTGQARYIALGGQMVVTGVQYPSQVEKDGSLRVEVDFVAARPIIHDYTVSLSLASEASSWHTQHDGTPALGAIPTLKWIRGTRVVDEHTLLLPPQATGRGRLRLTVYDAFTVKPLAVLDERLARLGQGTQIDLGTVEVR